jgi:hypothetical protein
MKNQNKSLKKIGSLMLLLIVSFAGFKAQAIWPIGTVAYYQRNYLKMDRIEYFQREFVGLNAKGQQIVREIGPGNYNVTFIYSDFYERYALQYLTNQCKNSARVQAMPGLGKVRVCLSANIGISPDVPFGYTEVIPTNTMKYTPHRDSLLQVQLPNHR